MSKIYDKEYLAEIAETFDEVDRRVLLWENENPFAQFAAQTVSIDLSIYDAVEIGYLDIITTGGYSADRNHEVTPLRLNIGEKGSMQAMFGGSSQISGVFFMTIREATASTTGVAFASGYGGYPNNGWAVRNDMCVPHRIYGIQLGASAGDGSSGGTMNYPDLLHKPTINGVTLVEGLVTEDLNLGDTAHEEITQAEFDALTPEERDDGTVYFIKDGIMGNVFLDDNTPIGTIAPFGGTSDPSYWLICDGRAVSRTDYAALFGVIGTTYGAGDGSTTFNIPDLRGRTAQGAGTLGEETYTLGDSVDAGLPNITGSKRIGWPDASGPDTIMQPEASSGALGVAVTGTSNFSAPSIGGTYNNTLTFDASRSSPIYGNSSTVQPNAVITNYIIKYASTVSEHQANIDFYYPVGSYYETSNASFDPNVTWGGTWVLENEGQVHVSAGSNYEIGDTGGSETVTLDTTQIPNHRHQYGANTTHSDGTVVSGEALNVGLTNSSSTTIRRRYWDSTEYVGGGQAHNNMQPYIVVNRWHRTA